MPERERFGDFLLHERLAVGGMGELYLATRAERRSPPFALKIMARSYRENEEFVAMFQDEARIGMRLSHSNIVGVQEVGFADFTAYIVMEYVHGENLRTVLRTLDKLGERLAPALAVKLAIDVLRGLDHAHKATDENGQKLHLVHRNLSPDNILVSYEGQVKLLDFGIAKAEGRTTTTQVGVVKGKPQYMSPEQAKARIVDARSDLFSAAVVLRELLTSERRFPDDDLRWESARNWVPKSVPGLPPELDAILLRALESEAAHRYQTADEMATDLTRVARSGALPRAKESLPALLKRLFPESSARKFDSTDVTLFQKPRWETDEQERTRADQLAGGRSAPNLAAGGEPATEGGSVFAVDVSIQAGPTTVGLHRVNEEKSGVATMPLPPIGAIPSSASDDDETRPAADLATLATIPAGEPAAADTAPGRRPPDRDRDTAPPEPSEPSRRAPRGAMRTTPSPQLEEPRGFELDRRQAFVALAVLVPLTLGGLALWRLWPGGEEDEEAGDATPVAAPSRAKPATPRPVPHRTRRPLPKKTPVRPK